MTLLAVLGCEAPSWEAFIADQQAVFDTTGKCPTELVGDPPLREPVEGRSLADGGEVEVVSDVAMVNADLGADPPGSEAAYGEVGMMFEVLVSLRHALPKSCFKLHLRDHEPERFDFSLAFFVDEPGADATV